MGRYSSALILDLVHPSIQWGVGFTGVAALAVVAIGFLYGLDNRPLRNAQAGSLDERNRSMPDNQVQVRAILFDLDDTLIDRVGALTRLNRYWYRTLPRDHRPESEDEFVARMFSAADRSISPRELYDWMLSIWPGSFRDADAALSAHNAIYPSMTKLTSRTRGMLSYLRGVRIPIGVVTNGPTLLQWAKLRNAGVDSLVDAVVVSEDCGGPQASPEHIRARPNADRGRRIRDCVRRRQSGGRHRWRS